MAESSARVADCIPILRPAVPCEVRLAMGPEGRGTHQIDQGIRRHWKYSVHLIPRNTQVALFLFGQPFIRLTAPADVFLGELVQLVHDPSSGTS